MTEDSTLCWTIKLQNWRDDQFKIDTLCTLVSLLVLNISYIFYITNTLISTVSWIAPEVPAWCKDGKKNKGIKVRVTFLFLGLFGLIWLVCCCFTKSSNSEISQSRGTLQHLLNHNRLRYTYRFTFVFPFFFVWGKPTKTLYKYN